MNKDMLVIRVSGILTDQRLEELKELFKAQLPDDQPFILIDESVEELDVLYGLNDGEESNNESVRDDIINNIVKQISDWRNNSISKHRINGIEYGELNQIIKILHDYRFMSVSMFKDLTKVINEHKEYAERSRAEVDKQSKVRYNYKSIIWDIHNAASGVRKLPDSTLIYLEDIIREHKEYVERSGDKS